MLCCAETGGRRSPGNAAQQRRLLLAPAGVRCLQASSPPAELACTQWLPQYVSAAGPTAQAGSMAPGWCPCKGFLGISGEMCFDRDVLRPGIARALRFQLFGKLHDSASELLPLTLLEGDDM